jgi:hypothetical protein
LNEIRIDRCGLCSRSGLITTGNAAEGNSQDIFEVGITGFETRGMKVCDIVSDDLHSGRMGIETAQS